MDYSSFKLPDLPLLTDEETYEYIKLAQEDDKSALDKLVEHNLKLVLKIAYRFQNTDYDLQDLFQIGVIGLIKAIKGFDLSRNVKLSTYAVARIIGEIRLYMRDDGIIKVSRSLKKIANVIRQKEEEMKKKLNRLPSINELAAATDFPKEKIIQALEANQNPSSIYQTINEDSGGDIYLIDSLKDEEQGNDLNKLVLVEVLKKLDERSRKIIYLRYFADKTQEEIAQELGVSQVQISRLERKILQKMKELLA